VAVVSSAICPSDDVLVLSKLTAPLSCIAVMRLIKRINS
jgi:hypothetical protein